MKCVADDLMMAESSQGEECSYQYGVIVPKF